MRKFSKHTPEQIVVKLEKAEALRGEGMSTAQACRVLGISEATLCRWRQRYGSMSRSEAKELRELREQNARLKQLLGQAELEKAALRELAEERNPFDDGGTYLKVCRYRVEASALGAALQHVERFIEGL